jgi:hypothetical protein
LSDVQSQGKVEFRDVVEMVEDLDDDEPYELYQALYDYKGEEDDLSFEAGEIIKVTDAGWIRVQMCLSCVSCAQAMGRSRGSMASRRTAGKARSRVCKYLSVCMSVSLILGQAHLCASAPSSPSAAR